MRTGGGTMIFRFFRFSSIWALFITLSFLFGCTNYYRITNPDTGKAYYSTEVDEKGDGVLEFTDARTGEKVTLPGSEVREITKEEFETNRAR
jgi:hypothetical protein